jgi:hypothetical protein
MTALNGQPRRQDSARRGTNGERVDRERTVRRYLSALENGKPGGRGPSRAGEAIDRRVQKIDELMVSADPLTRLHLTQERIELHSERVRISSGRGSELPALEREFVRVARSYSDQAGIAYAAWRQIGVDADVLERAGISRAARPGPKGRAEGVDADRRRPAGAVPPSSGADEQPAAAPAAEGEAGDPSEPAAHPAASGVSASVLAAWLDESGEDHTPASQPVD